MIELLLVFLTTPSPCVAAGIASSAVSAADEVTPWVDYKQPQGTLRLRVPKDYQVRVMESGMVVVSEDESQNVAACIAVRSGDRGQSAEEAGERFLSVLRTAAEEFKTSRGLRIKGPVSMYKCGVFMRRGGQSYIGRLTVQHYDNGVTGYFYYQADGKRFKALQPVLQRILSSCTWDKGGGSQ